MIGIREKATNQSENALNAMNTIGSDGKLTEVQGHADKNNQAEPGVEVGDEVNDGNDNVSDGGEDAEHNVTVRQREGNRLDQGSQTQLSWGPLEEESG